MSLIALVITLAVIGLLLWLILTYLPLAEPFKKIITVVVVLVTVLWLLQVFGVLGGADIRVPKLH